MAGSNPDLPVFLNVDLKENPPTDADFTAMYEDAAKAFEADLDPEDETSPGPGQPAPPAAPAAPAPPAPVPKELCDTWYKVVLDHFEIFGKDFDPGKFGKDGKGLKEEISGE